MFAENASSLTPESVALAKERVGVVHPILAAIDQQMQTIEVHNERMKSIIGTNDAQAQQAYIGQNYRFLAEAFVEAGPFTLKPEEMISIYSRVSEVFPSYYQRDALVTLISGAYAIQDLDSSRWQIFPQSIYNPSINLSVDLMLDKEGWFKIRERTDQIAHNNEEINLYLDPSGIKPDEMLLLFRQSHAGDQEASQKLKEIEEFQAKHRRDDPLLKYLIESFKHAVGSLNFSFPPEY